MSLVYITHHNENIFDVEKQWKQEQQHCSNYISKFRERVTDNAQKLGMVELDDGKKLLTGSQKSQHKTMGYAETPIDPPCAFLRKHQGVRWRRFNDHVCPKGPGIPPVPRYVRPDKTASKKDKKEPLKDAHKRFLKNHHHRANFILVNIDRMKKIATKVPPPRYVDTPNGDRHNLLNTGLVPQYICSKNFGKVPPYLRAHKQMLQQLNERCKATKYDTQTHGPQKRDSQKQEPQYVSYATHGIRQLTPEERQEILAGLKRNFVEVNKHYQKLPLYTDTIPKMLRKGKVEKDLRQLEQDIFLMESNPVIYISQY